MSHVDFLRGILQWRKASYSDGNGECVEVASLKKVILVRDSKNPEGQFLAYHQEQWRYFTDSIAGRKR